MQAALLAVAALALAACAGAAPREPGPTPPAPMLGAGVPDGDTAWSNASLARLFGTLAFGLEWGEERRSLARLAAPVAISAEGTGSGRYATFLDRYAAFLTERAGVAVGRGTGASRIHVRFVEGDAFTRVLPAAACVVAPGDVGWRAFRLAPAALGGQAMARAERLDGATIFVPASAPPHVVRGCLIEEIAQALGLANDLYGLAPSIFNDDAAHVWPTALDLLMVRTLYAPEVEPGMDRAAAEAAALAALDRLNPAGRDAPPLPLVEDRALGEWRQIAQRIFARGAGDAARAERARAALALARRTAPETPQHCQSQAVLARVSVEAPDRRAAALGEARRLCAGIHGSDDIRIARLALEEGIALLRAGRAEEAIAVTDGLEARFAALGQDERLATLYALRARAYRDIQHEARAAEARRLAVEWGAYAFGADGAALARWLAE